MVYAIIPAAGIGSRMQSSIPKQYLPLCGATVLLHSIRALLALKDISRLVIALNPSDLWWPQTRSLLTDSELQRIATCEGGAERWQSVRSALELINKASQHNDWVLIHDAVRPCVRQQDLRALLDFCGAAPASVAGALLATPVSDTLKRATDSFSVQSTVDRSTIWQAFTPQMFRLGELQRALADALLAGVAITDEASAMEWAGQSPRLIEGRSDNLKVTRPEDLLSLNRLWQGRS